MVELMAVIAIMAILAAAATPVFSGYVRRARAAQHLTQCRSVYIAVQTCLAGQEEVEPEELAAEVTSLTGLEDVIACFGSVPSEAEAADTGYSFYVEDGECTAVVYKDPKDGAWVLETLDGSFTEIK